MVTNNKNSTNEHSTNKLNEYSIIRTKLSNQRTYLAYMRTGLAIASLAGIFKKIKIVFLGLFMIISSAIQYYYINNNLNNKKNYNSEIFDYLPLIYVLLSFLAFYLQFYKEN